MAATVLATQVVGAQPAATTQTPETLASDARGVPFDFVKWGALAVSAIALLLSYLGYRNTQKSAQTTRKIEINQLLAEAGDLMGGQEGTTALVSNRRVEPSQLELANWKIQEALTLDANHPRAHSRHGSYLHLRGKHAEAVTALRNAIRLDPHDSVSHNWLAARGESPSL